MHNLHFVVVKAETGEEACDIVETQISNWGNENNWRTMCGAVSENNEVYYTTDGRYPPSKDSNTIAKINKKVKGWLKGNYYGGTAKELLAKGKKVECFSQQEAWSLMKYAEYLHELKLLKLTKTYQKKAGKKVSPSFDILSDEFYSWKFDERGVTRIDYENEGKVWVVFVDMHS